jgi:hypothetical protein
VPGRIVAALAAAAVAASGAPGPAAPQRLCAVTDARLAELSGLVVADPTSFWAIVDSGRRTVAYRVDRATCAVTGTRTAPIDPNDAEDLASGPDGALWVADVGDNDRTRDTVAVIVLPARGAPTLHRLVYPDGPHDAEALLVDGAGRPVIVTKEGGFGTGVYRTAEPLAGAGPTPLVRVGSVTLPASDATSGPLGALGSRLVTGAAATADRKVVALRSYTDAWLYPVRDGDVAAAVTGSAVRVPLPDEPQGEALAFTADGTLLSGSEARGGVDGQLRAVPGAAGLTGAARGREPTAEPTAAESPDDAAEPVPAWRTAAIGAGVLVVILAVLALVMARHGARRR